MSALQEIPVAEFARNTVEGRFIYCLYQGRCVRRPERRGNPSYVVVTGIRIQDSDRIRRRRVNVNSRLGKLLLSKV